MTEGQPIDLILSYTVTVGEGGITIGSSRHVEDALAQGYRIVDVITTPCGTGEHSFVCVTVVMTLKSSLVSPYKGFTK